MQRKLILYGFVLSLGLVFSNSALSSMSSAYKGKLQCTKLNQQMSYFPPLQVGRFCADAINNCDLMEKFKALKEEDPLRQEMGEEFIKQFVLSLQECELAIYSYSTSYYMSKMKRPGATAQPETQAEADEYEDNYTIEADEESDAQDIQ